MGSEASTERQLLLYLCQRQARWLTEELLMLFSIILPSNKEISMEK